MHYEDFTVMISESVQVAEWIQLKVQVTAAAGLPMIVEPVASRCRLDLLAALACPQAPPAMTSQLEAGAALGNALLPQEIGQRFRQALMAVRARGRGLRIRIVGGDHVHALPWEYAVLPSDHGESIESDFLALMPDVSIVRDQSIPPTTWPRSTLPFRIAAAAAHPRCTDPLDVTRERTLLERALRDVTAVELTWSPAGTRPSMSDKAEMFHFAGHGALVRGAAPARVMRDLRAPGAPPAPDAGTGHLVFEGANGEADYLSAGQLGVILREMGVRVAVLNACRTASRDGSRSWSSLAAALLKAGVRSVVAMQHNVLDDSAIAFASAFYRALAMGGSLDEAARNGRIAVFDRGDNFGWGTPVLYACGPDGPIFPEARRLAVHRSALQEIDQQVRQTYRSRVLRSALTSPPRSTPQPEVRLRVLDGPGAGRALALQARDRLVAGRSHGAHFQAAQDAALSRHHWMIEANAPNLLLRDLGSTNGTFVNGHRIGRLEPLHHGDVVSAGATRLRVELARRAELHVSLARTTIAVRCGRCGGEARHEQPRNSSEEVSYLCIVCRAALLAAPNLPPGYRLLRVLGRGAMGAVYLASHPEHGVHAIKLVLPRVAITRGTGQALLQELGRTTQLRHPNIVQSLAGFELSPGIFAAAMEHLDGRSVVELVREQPRGVAPRDAAHIVIEVLDGLAYAHAQGVVHRDLKSANVLVGGAPGRPVVKLADLGLASACDVLGILGGVIVSDDPALVAQMAPERILSFGNVTATADLYAAGAVLYHLVTARLPFEFSTHRDPLTTILEDEIVPIARRRADVPMAIAAVAEQALHKDPAQRFRSAKEMQHALVTALAMPVRVASARRS